MGFDCPLGHLRGTLADIHIGGTRWAVFFVRSSLPPPPCRTRPPRKVSRRPRRFTTSLLAKRRAKIMLPSITHLSITLPSITLPSTMHRSILHHSIIPRSIILRSIRSIMLHSTMPRSIVLRSIRSIMFHPTMLHSITLRSITLYSMPLRSTMLHSSLRPH